MCPCPGAFSFHVCLLGAREMPREGDAWHRRCVVQVSQPVPTPRVVTAGTVAHLPHLTPTVTPLGPIPGMLPRLPHSPRAPWLGAHPRSLCPGSCCLDCPEEGAACPGKHFCDSCSYVEKKQTKTKQAS